MSHAYTSLVPAIRDFVAYVGVRILWGVAGWTPLRLLRAVLAPVSSVIMRTTRGEVIEANIRRAFPELSDDEIARSVRVAAAYWGRLAAEVAHAHSLTDEDALARAQPALEAFNRARAGDSGLLVLTAHLGNFELMARLVARFTPQFAVLHRGFRNRFFERFYDGRRRAAGVEVLQRTAGMRTALRVLNSGGTVAIALDQNQRAGRGIFVDMFGTPACTSTVMARLSLASGLPVLPMFAVWDGDRLALDVSEPIRPGGPGSPAAGLSSREDKVRALTERYTKEIEDAVRRHPEQWNWGHRRWKTRPDEVVAEEPVRQAVNA